MKALGKAQVIFELLVLSLAEDAADGVEFVPAVASAPDIADLSPRCDFFGLDFGPREASVGGAADAGLLVDGEFEFLADLGFDGLVFGGPLVEGGLFFFTDEAFLFFFFVFTDKFSHGFDHGGCAFPIALGAFPCFANGSGNGVAYAVDKSLPKIRLCGLFLGVGFFGGGRFLGGREVGAGRKLWLLGVCSKGRITKRHHKQKHAQGGIQKPPRVLGLCGVVWWRKGRTHEGSFCDRALLR